ncbi:MAG: HAD family hydrolase [Firmicutes bacterium]|nr:HAD family hydrolase [Bacillota bacterium]
MLNYKDILYVSDLDGTLLNNNGVLSENSISTLKKFVNLGFSFSIATGKSYETTKAILESLKIKIPVITYDGVCIYDENRDMVVCNFLDEKILSDILKKTYIDATSFLVYSLTDGKEKIFWNKNKKNNYVNYYLKSRNNDPRLEEVEDVNKFFQGNILFISFLDNYKNIVNLKEKLEKIGISNSWINKDSYKKDMYWLKIKSLKATKGNAIKELLKILNKKWTISIGNGSNDIDMLESSDVAICVANATAGLKKYSDYEIMQNDKDGVAEFLKNQIDFFINQNFLKNDLTIHNLINYLYFGEKIADINKK